MTENAISRWLNRGVDEKDAEGSIVAKKHAGLAELNATVTEYAMLLEQVSAERAELLASLSTMQLQVAELSVSKTIYGDLEKELVELRKKVELYAHHSGENRRLVNIVADRDSTLCEMGQELIEQKRINATLKGKLTRQEKK